MSATALLVDARIDGRADAHLSDEESILRAYARWGADAALHLLGDYAFALRDGERIFAARDHAGVRPLFYAEHEGSLLVAGTIRELLARGVPNDLDDRGIVTFLLGGTYDDPVATSFAAVKRLPAAHTLTWSAAEGVVTRRYWSPPTEGAIRHRAEDQYIDHFLAVFDEAVRDRLRGDAAAALMSGGLDSTSVAATARRLLRDDRALLASTVAFRDRTDDREAAFAAKVAASSRMEHTVHYRDDYRLFDGVPLRDEPYDDSLAGPFLAAAREASSRSTILLTGQGGDAVFYTSHGHFRGLLGTLRLGTFVRDIASYARRYRRLPPLNLRAALRAKLGAKRWMPSLPPWVRGEWLERFDLAPSFAARTPGGDVHPVRPEAQRILLDPNWSLLFEAWHRGQTGIAIDVVDPFFDRRVLELLLAYPPMPFFADKQLLRESMRGRLPDEVRLRPKTPLAASPLRLAMAAEQPRLLAMLRDAPPELDRWIDRPRLATALRHEAGDGYSIYLAILPFCLARWLASRNPPMR